MHAECNVLREICAILCGRGAPRRTHLRSTLRRQEEQLPELEPDVRALLHLVADGWKTLQIARDRERVAVRHFVKPFVRHHRREQTSILRLTVSQRAHELCFAPGAEARPRIR